MRIRVLLAALAVTVATTLLQSQEPALVPCTVRGLDGDVRCGSVLVPEDRGNPSGRKISISVVVARATGANRAPDPFMLLAGGPGQAGTEMGPFATTAFGAVRERRDIVLIDARGTGRSNGLMCTMLRRAEDAFAPTLYPNESVRFCRDSLGRHADLRQYTTANIADDIEDVRRAFGWPALNFYGTSYGTRVAFVFLARHESSVRTMTLKAVVPPGIVFPMNYARDAEAAMSLLERDCRADANCARAVASMRSLLDTVLTSAARGQAMAVVPNDRGGADTVRLDRDVIAATLMSAMQSAGDRASIPAVLLAASRGDYGQIARVVALTRHMLSTTFAMGMHLSTSCADDGRRLDLRAAARDDGTTFLGGSRVRMVADACAEWPAGPETPKVFEPVRSSKPVLLVSGEIDPNTPPSGAELVMSGLPNGRHVVLKGVSHSWHNVADCGRAFVADFVERLSARNLDVACASVSGAPPFLLPR